MGLDVVGDQGAMHQGHLGIDCLDLGVSASDVGANESEKPFARGVHLGEVSVADLVDEVGGVVKVCKSHGELLSQGFHYASLEHQYPVSFVSVEQSKERGADIGCFRGVAEGQQRQFAISGQVVKTCFVRRPLALGGGWASGGRLQVQYAVAQCCLLLFVQPLLLCRGKWLCMAGRLLVSVLLGLLERWCLVGWLGPLWEWWQVGCVGSEGHV